MVTDFYKSGYQYAAGVLLSTEKTPTQLGEEILKSPDTMDTFYEGMRAALWDYLAIFEGAKE